VLSLERVATAPDSLVLGAQPVPDTINREIARRMLAAMKADR
jgi:adenosylhomocysteinase